MTCTFTVTVATAQDDFSKVLIILKDKGTNYISVDHYCSARLSAGAPPSTLTQTLLGCHLDAPVGGNDAFGVTGFTYGGSTNFELTVRLTAKDQTSLDVDVELQALNNANAYATMEEFTGSGSLAPVDTSGKGAFTLLCAE